jgi:AraC-like DNA-binding protein
VPNPMLLFTAQIVAIMSVLLLAAGYLKTDPRAASARVFGLMAVFVVFYLLNGMTNSNIAPEFRIDLSSISILVSVTTSFLIFQEQQRFPLTLGAAFAMQVSLDLLLSLLSLSGGEGLSGGSALLDTSMDILQLVFVGFAIYWTLKGWRADLVEDRRIFRWFIIGVQGALIFLVVFLENFFIPGGSSSNATLQTVIVMTIAVLTLGMLLAAMRFDFVSLSQAIRKVTEPAAETELEGSEIFDVDTFNRAFKDGRLYREAGLTISMLAKKLNIPEYRLRSFIHKQLGFRNFNAMLHEYRIEDASQVLSDRESQNLPVLTIALSVGYQSITPFNNAFRQIKGVTPSEYRKQHLA